MNLYYTEQGEGEYFTILHGLYGSSDNWNNIAKMLSDEFKVIAVDLPNHGRSPKTEQFNLSFLGDSVYDFLKQKNIKKTHLLGHSLGGKIALEIASKYPQIVDKLIIVDIAPRNYLKNEFQERENHEKIINILKNVDLSKYKNRSEALTDLVKIDKSGRLKMFMMKNISRNKNGKLEWKINLKAISDNLSQLLNQFDTKIIDIKNEILFIKAENSPYINSKDIDFIRQNFAKATIKIIPDTTHWIHAEKPQTLVKEIKNFVKILM